MKNMYLIFGIIIVIVVAIFAFRDDVMSEMEEREKPVIAASFFPIAEIARQVGGDDVTVRQIVSGQANIHDFEPAPSDLNKVQTADLFIYNGYELDPWAEELTAELEEEGVRYLEAANLVEGIENEDHHDEDKMDETAPEGTVIDQAVEAITEGGEGDEHGHDHAHGEYDPHIWLSIKNMITITNAVRDELISINPEMAQDYSDNAERYITLLEELDRSYREGLATCQTNTAIVSHNAYSYLGEQYGIEFISIAGLSPQDEPSSQELAELTLMANDADISYVFAEPLASDDQVQTIADEIGAEVLMLNPVEGRSEEDMKNEKTYVQIMQENLKQLRTGLECQ